SAFRAQCRRRLATFAASLRPEAVAIPQHAATDAMVELLEEAYTSIGDTADPRPAIVRVPDGPLSDQADAILGPARRILVLDDALVTGATLSTLRGRIYDANQLRQHAAEVGAFVVV